MGTAVQQIAMPCSAESILHYTARLQELSIISQYPSSFTVAAVLLLS